MKSQEKEILIHLVNGKSITPLEALEKFGCFRLSGRIYDLKKNGWNIKTRIIKKNNKYFAEYYLPETKRNL